MIKRIEVWPQVDGTWRWFQIGNNGSTLSRSSGYATRQGCQKTAEKVARQLNVPVVLK